MSEQQEKEKEITLKNQNSNGSNDKQHIPQYVNVKQLSELFPAFSELSIRWLLFNRTTNGADSFVIKVGKKKLIIDTEKFQAWLNHQH